MDQVLQGGQYTGRVLYRLSTGPLVDPDAPYVDVLDSNNAVVSGHTLLVRDDLGEYHITFTVPADGALGTWTMQYYGVINGAEVTSSEQFSVIDAGEASPIVQTTLRMRRLLGERIPVGGTEANTRFTDSELMAMYYANNSDFNKAMAEAWLAKAAMFADLVDISESGTVRSLSQMQRAASVQAKVWQDRVNEYDNAWAATYRVVGKTFAPYGDGCKPMIILSQPVTVRG